MLSLYEVSQTRVRVESELLEEFEVKVGMQHGSALLPLFAVLVDVDTELAREGVLNELEYAGDLVSKSERVEGQGISSQNGRRFLRVKA